MKGDWKPTAIVFRRLLDDFLDVDDLPAVEDFSDEE